MCLLVCVCDFKFLLIPSFQEKICCNPLTENSAERRVGVQRWIAQHDWPSKELSAQGETCSHSVACLMLCTYIYTHAYTHTCTFAGTYEYTLIHPHTRAVWNTYLLKEPICRSLLITAPSASPKNFPVWERRERDLILFNKTSHNKM